MCETADDKGGSSLFVITDMAAYPLKKIWIIQNPSEFILQVTFYIFFCQFQFIPNAAPVVEHKNNIFKIGTGTSIIFIPAFKSFHLGSYKKGRREDIYMVKPVYVCFYNMFEPKRIPLITKTKYVVAGGHHIHRNTPGIDSGKLLLK